VAGRSIITRMEVLKSLFPGLGKGLLDGIRSRSVELMGDFERMDVSDILWSFATVGEHPGQVRFRTVANAPNPLEMFL
jgi:hypothetical protein